MSNKPSPELRPIRAMQPEGESATLLSLDLQGSALCALHQHPGQYVQLSVPEGPAGYFALANAPGRPPGVFEVLVKEGGAAADAIRRLLLPAELMVSAPMGAGFPLEKARGKALILLTMGSGISALRPVIQLIAEARASYKDVFLLQGDRSLSRMPFASEHARWREAGIEVRAVLSQSEAELRGYVHHHLGDLPFEEAVVFLSGSKEMMAMTRLELAKNQLGPDRIFTNF